MAKSSQYLCLHTSAIKSQNDSSILTDTGVLVEVAGLVAADDASGLNLGSRATGETGVEVHNTLHTGSILSSTNGLERIDMLAIVRGRVAGICCFEIARKSLREGTGRREGRDERSARRDIHG